MLQVMAALFKLNDVPCKDDRDIRTFLTSLGIPNHLKVFGFLARELQEENFKKLNNKNNTDNLNNFVARFTAPKAVELQLHNDQSRRGLLNDSGV